MIHLLDIRTIDHRTHRTIYLPCEIIVSISYYASDPHISNATDTMGYFDGRSISILYIFSGGECVFSLTALAGGGDYVF
jgi:hypothetical protein